VNIHASSSLSSIASQNLGLNSSAKVTGVRVSNPYIFIGVSDPNSGFQVRRISGSTVPLVVNPNSSFNFEQDTTGVDFTDNTIYLSSNSGSRTLEIVGPKP
jgi:hypothetical protein